MPITVWLDTENQNDLVEFPTATAAEVNPSGVLRLYRTRENAYDVQLGSIAPGVWKYFIQEDPGDPEEPEPGQQLAEPEEPEA